MLNCNLIPHPDWITEKQRMARSFRREENLTSRMVALKKEIAFILKNQDQLDMQTLASLEKLQVELTDVGLALADLYQEQLQRKWNRDTWE